MKSSTLNVFCCVAGMILAASGVGLSQIATTDPVGFITLNVAGTGGASAEALSFKGLGLTRLVEYQGIAEAVGASSVTDNDANWTEGQFNGANGEYYLEIISGAGAGRTYDIATTTAATKTITLTENLTGITAPVSFKIRKHWTIGAVFGPNNEAGLGGGAPGEADEILIFNPATGAFQTYYYKVGGIGGDGWRNASTGAVASTQKIYPDDGLLMKRRQSANANVVLIGAVKTGQTSIPVFKGLNFLGNVYAANMTLTSSGLYTGNSATGVAGGAPGEADEVLIYNQGSKGYITYFYKVGGLGGNGWRNATDGTDAANVSIPVGSSIVVRRKAATSFDWIAPQHPAAL